MGAQMSRMKECFRRARYTPTAQDGDTDEEEIERVDVDLDEEDSDQLP